MRLETIGTADSRSPGQETGHRVTLVGPATGAFYDHVVAVAVWAALFLLPVVFFSPAEAMFSVPKAALLHSLAIVVVVATSLKLFAGRPLVLYRSPLDLPIAAYLAVVLFAFLLANSRDAALFGVGGRSDGLLTLLSAVVLYYAAYHLPPRRWLLERGLQCLTVGAALAAVEGIAENFGFSLVGFTPDLWEMRAYSTSGNPDFLGGLLTLAWPLALALLVAGSPRARPLWAAAFALILAGLFVTFTRGAWLGSLAAVVVLLLLARRELARSWRRLAVTLAVVALFALLVETGALAQWRHALLAPDPGAPAPPAAAAPAPGEAAQPAPAAAAPEEQETLRGPSALERLRLVGDDSSGGSGRLFFWRAALAAVRDSPLLGIGFGNVGALSGRLPLEWSKLAPGLWVDKAHNVFLDQAVAYGLPGLLAYLWLLGAFAWAMWRHIRVPRPADSDPTPDSSPFPRREGGQGVRLLAPQRILLIALFAAWVGYLAHLFFLFDTVDTLAIFWLLMGLAAREIGRTGQPVVVRPRLPAAVRAVLALGVVGLGALVVYWAVQPVVAESYLWNAQVGAEEHRVEDAVIDYLKAAAINPHSQNIQTQAAIGLTVFASGETSPQSKRHLLDEAVRIWSRAIQQDPAYPYLYAMRGETYTRYGNGERVADALADFRRAAALYPHYSHAYAGIVDTARALNLFGEAIAAERKLLELHPDDQRVLRILAQDYVRTGRLAEAIATWERLIALGGESANLRLSIAQALLQSGRRERAREELARARALDPANEQVEQLWQQLQQDGRQE